MATVAIANQEFKGGYNRYLRNSLYAAMVIHFVTIYFSPPFEFKPYVLKEQEFIVVETADDFELPPPPQEIDQPVIPMEAAEGEEVDEDTEIAPTSFDRIDNLPPPPPPPTENAQEFYAFDEPPQLVKYVSPKYPNLAQSAGIEGTVTIRVVVGIDGKVESASVLQSDVTPAMERAAITAAKQFVFKPAKQRTVPVRASMAVPIRFKLHGR
ncbi:MAG: energy transducer TonB [Candidatus Krumholzibacteriota bacterium]|nr:energy transducer TonB [Candidatus Krumholzibacteriota bacterium]